MTLDELHALLGPWPERCPAAATVVRREPLDGYERREVRYDVGPGERIAAYVLVPDGATRAPALFCHHQHASDFGVGKSEVVGLGGDPERIGFTGHSYGGRMAIWAPAFDRRIKASVSNCGCVSYEDSLAREVGIQPEFCVPGILSLGDIEDVVRLVAPRALYLSAGSDDKYSRGAERIAEYARDAFPAGQLECRVWNGGHAFTEERREAAYDFLSRRL